MTCATPPVLRALIYARVSSERQRDRNTIASQLSELPGAVAAQGWTLVGTFQDDGVSGKTVFDRPAFKEVMALAEARAFDVLVTVDTDRIGRPELAAEAALLQDYLAERNIRLFSPSQGLTDLRNDDAFFMTTIRLGMARLNRIKFVAATQRGKREAVRKKRRYGCRDPYGYRWVHDEATESRGSYQIREAEAAVVRRMVELALAAQGIAMIAWTLAQEGVTTRPFKRHPRGGPWQCSSLRKVLRSATIKGEFQILKETSPVVMELPPIVDAATWARVQEALDGRRALTRRVLQGEYLLTGLAKCGVCGFAMWVTKPKVGHGTKAYYRCSSSNAWRKMGLPGPCGNHFHETRAIDAAVWTEVAQALASPRLLAEACSMAVYGADEGVDWLAQRAACARKLKELEALEAEVLVRRRRGQVSASACGRELDALARERNAVTRNLVFAEGQLTTAKGGRERLRELEQLSEQIAAKVAGATFVERQALVRLVVPPGPGAVRLLKDGGIEIQGLLRLGEEDVSLALTARSDVRRSG